MFLTRFRVNTARDGARRLLSSPQLLHGAVMASFAEPPSSIPSAIPSAAAGSVPRVLWRIDHNSRSEVLLYLVGPQRPDLTHLVEQAGWPTTGGWQTFDYGAFLAGIAAGSTFAFRLTANPVHSIRRKPDEPTKRTAHLTQRHQAAWLLNQQQRSGFTVVEKAPDRRLLPEGDEHELVVHRQHAVSFGKNDRVKAGRHRVTLVTATYDGRLRVTDPDALRRTLTAGLGKAKAYGCGLMTLAPVRG
ncbi:type I-E CRISPR-associated protein Cas6/Cse3/CasE [Kitasatospora purpeofusca]|uniref:type I-E CRISPR-associated protein Cas6/Cse3/CasE n=1 Tax=Kitasatospora purpeofusca TaxID=67352 RepID=UPI0022531228|nr:type I-E CRISPR-associated protein Cas6/Cse3/CasE [Kitasatospora purpeofusca]MCX4756840.1 type I-E CRISPR-associated protein Cas6/Cse3/CasE [Kitasatospora purpeofusca]WSR35383.1 type I-E CRISPR-associated protein Cas6/Cse3/CasE [Kitasatospora purpeofusca]WSR43702.1 type I-E CRISPR-associated protein Cas6/Cse3/CasE [Kitasatospora purpeofusca]